MTVMLVRRTHCTDERLAPQLLRRHQPLSGGEIRVNRWLHQSGVEADHERWFYPFWIDARGQEHGFRLDFTFQFRGQLMGIEVCEAGRYPVMDALPAGANLKKWRHPDVKLADKRSKIARLASIHGLPCALVTEAEIDLWGSLQPAERRDHLEHHLLGALGWISHKLAS